MAATGGVGQYGNEVFVQARGLTVKVGRRVVLAGADLEVAGGVHGLLGRNGAGKTTLLRTISTLLRPTGGRLTVLGAQVPRARDELRRLRAQIGYSPQALAVLPHLSALDQVTYAGWLKGMPTLEAERSATQALAKVDLHDRRHERVGRLSGGMLRRVSIAMAIVHHPSLVLLDEPTAGLDPEQRVAFRRLVTELGDQAAVLLSTHLIEDVLAVCERVSVLSQARRVFTGTPAELASRSPAILDGVTAHEAAFLSLTKGSQDV